MCTGARSYEANTGATSISAALPAGHLGHQRIRLRGAACAQISFQPLAVIAAGRPRPQDSDPAASGCPRSSTDTAPRRQNAAEAGHACDAAFFGHSISCLAPSAPISVTTRSFFSARMNSCGAAPPTHQTPSDNRCSCCVASLASTDPHRPGRRQTADPLAPLHQISDG